jgi:hypothetical protein
MVAGAEAGPRAGDGAAEGPGLEMRGVMADSLLTRAPDADAALDSAALAWASAFVGRPRFRFAWPPGVVAED